MTHSEEADASDATNPAVTAEGATSATAHDDVPTETGSAASGAWRVLAMVAVVVALGLWKGWAMVAVIGSIAAIIFMHELGHYLTARWAGMKVTDFFLGFGPTVWSRQVGETRIGIKAIPAGAFVKVPGMTREDDVSAADEPRTYRRAPFHKRVIFASAGSGMHFLMAICLFFAQAVFFGSPDPSRLVIDNVFAASAADQAGVKAGDRVVSVDGVTIDANHDLGEVVRARAGKKVPIVVERDGRTLHLTGTLGTMALIFGTVHEDLRVFFTADGPVLALGGGARAAQAGLHNQDKVNSLNGLPVADGEQLKAAVAATKDGTLRFDVTPAKGGAPRVATVDLGKAVDVKFAGQIGVSSTNEVVKASVASAAGGAFTSFADYTKLSVQNLGTALNPANLLKFFRRAATTAPGTANVEPTKPAPASDFYVQQYQQNANRPVSLVGSVSLATDMARVDFGQLLLFLATLNVFIGLFNLIPLLPFDGGHIAVACYEKVRELLRRDGRRYLVSPSALYPMAIVVVTVLGLLFLSSVYLDLVDPIRLG